MSAVLKDSLTLEAFLEWESCQEQKYEFDGFHPVAMTGGSVEHSRIQRNLLTALTNRSRGHRCEAHGGELRIQVAGRIRYPDAFIVCSPIPPGAARVHDPVVVFEVLSPSTSDTDRYEKNQEYRDTPSIQRYVMLEQSRPAAMVFTRNGDDWIGHVVPGGADLVLPEAGIAVPMMELYEGVTFPAAPPAGLSEAGRG